MIKLVRKSFILMLILTVILMFGACAGKNNEDNSSRNYEMQSVGSASNEKSDILSSAESGLLKESKYADTDMSGDASLPSDRKIIRNASLDIEADDAAGLYKQLAAYGNSLGGYEFSYNISNYEAYSVIRAVIKIPPEKLNTFINFIGENAKVVNSSMSSDDITEDYFDMQTRLETTRKSLERYYTLLESADTVDKILQIQMTIDNITLEIESYEGRLKVWNSLVDMATVDIYIRQDNDPVKIRKDISWNTLTFDDMGYLIKRGFVSLVNAIISLLQWIVIAVLVCSPAWVIGLCVALVMRKVKKKHRNKNGIKDMAEPGDKIDSKDKV